MNIIFENPDWQPVVDALRGELQEYGGLYNLLCEQQDVIIRREPETVLEINERIEEQTSVIAKFRSEREALVRNLADRAGAESKSSLLKLLGFFPDYVRPMLESLVSEINLMLHRTRNKARQNHLLLSRALELTEETLRILKPESFTKTYGRSGQVGRTGKTISRYQAVG